MNRDELKNWEVTSNVDLRKLFPKGSQSFLDANPLSSPSETQASVNLAKPRRGRMNRTESEYALILDAEKRAGKILRYEFEGFTLRFAGVKYTPDFYVLSGIVGLPGEQSYPLIKFIEIKGRYIKGKFERAIERFRHARTYWPEFTFEMHQKSKDGWKQIL